MNDDSPCLRRTMRVDASDSLVRLNELLILPWGCPRGPGRVQYRPRAGIATRPVRSSGASSPRAGPPGSRLDSRGRALACSGAMERSKVWFGTGVAVLLLLLVGVWLWTRDTPVESGNDPAAQ